MVETNNLSEISLEEFEKLSTSRIVGRISRKEFLKEYRKTILEWLKRNEETIVQSMRKYSWRNKSHEESIRVRNELERAITQSRQKNNGGIDLETADKICMWGFGRVFPLRDPQKVIEITQKAFVYVDKGDYYNGAKTLMSISGVGIATATKIIGLSNQNKLAIYDSRVGYALREMRKNSAKVIPCPPGQSHKRDRDSKTKNGWAMNYERLIWVLEIMIEYFKAKGLSFRIADIEMALFMMGQGNCEKHSSMEICRCCGSPVRNLVRCPNCASHICNSCVDPFVGVCTSCVRKIFNSARRSGEEEDWFWLWESEEDEDEGNQNNDD